MTRRLAVCALVLAACKGEIKTQDSPETLRALEACQEGRAEKDRYIKELEARLFDLEQKAGSSQEVVVQVTGDAITISGKGPSERSGGPVASDEALFESFVKQVQGARTSMQRCYQNALKKDTNLQARTLTLTIQVRFSAAGKVSRATFTPQLSDAFDTCMSTVTSRWKLDGAPEGITFQQPITLSPQ